MKINFSSTIIFVLFLLFLCSAASPALAQIITGVSVQPSNLIEEIKNKKVENPKIAPAEFAAAANALLARSGLNYSFNIDAATCKLIADKRRASKDGKPLSIRSTFTPLEGSQTNLFLTENQFSDGACGECFLKMPIIEATDQHFVAVVQGQNVKFQMPKNFRLETVELVDNVALASVKRRWQIPFKTVPVGVSDDGTILYLDLPDSDLKELTLAVYENGVAQIEAKKDLNLTEKAALLKDLPKDANNPSLSYISFGTGAQKRTLKFNAPCAK